MQPFHNIFSFYWSFIKHAKWKFILLACMPLIWCSAETFAPYVIKILLDGLSASHSSLDSHFLLMIAIIYIVLIAAVELSLRLSNYLSIQIIPTLKENIRTKILEFVQSYPYHFFQTQQAGHLSNDLKNLVDSFEQFYTSFFYGFYPVTVTFLISVFLIHTVSNEFALIFVLWYLGMNLITLCFLRSTIVSFNIYGKTESILSGCINDLIRNSLAFKIFPNRSLDNQLIQSLQKENLQACKTAEWTTFKTDSLRGLISFILLSIMFVFLIRSWQKGLISIGDFAFITTVCFYIRRSTWMAMLHLLTFAKYAGIAKQSFKTLTQSYPIEAKGHLKPRDALNKEIRFESIRFGYTEDTKIYNNFTFSILNHQKIGIMGPSGTGKTTLAHLLLKLVQPEGGNIYLGKYNLKDIDSDFIRENIAYTQQSPMLFHRSIFDNIHYGNPQASKEDILNASQACICHPFISKLEQGYDTIIGEDGTKLSGGQRQRIALARAYLKNAPIVILDEATSALDHTTEQKVLEAFLKQNKTIIIISHRPSALVHLERLIILKDGKIIEDGTPENLL